MPNIIIFALEPHDGRYSKQWFENIPKLIDANAQGQWNVIQISGVQKDTTLTPGAFLNFSDTNYWKSSQLCSFLDLYNQGQITSKDRFLFTDFWNPTITQIAYMRDLLKTQWELHSIVHAGAYDPTDILGMQMQKPWPWHQERSWFYASDYNYFATEFHRQMFLRNLDIPVADQGRAVRSGQPHELIVAPLENLRKNAKQNTVIWPHRLNADKQPEIVRDLAGYINADLIITQDQKLDKQQYYQTISETKVTFSCSLHENLGISQMEGCLTGSLPCVPDRASYSEMYLPEFRYPSAWTQDWQSYLKHRGQLAEFINQLTDNYDQYQSLLDQQIDILKTHFLNCKIMLKVLTQ
jgi:hypothetical protein